MGLLTKQALDFFVHKKSKCRSCCMNFMKRNGYLAAKQERGKQQDRKHQSISTDIIMGQVSIKTTSKNLRMSPEVGGANDIQTPSLPFEDQINQRRFSEETQQDLIYRTFCTRIDSGSEVRLQTWFDIHQERKMPHMITASQVNLHMNNDDTRLVNGLLTTTLCSTEL